MRFPVRLPPFCGDARRVSRGVLALNLVFPSVAMCQPAEELPPLRPPWRELPPPFWEQHGFWLAAGTATVSIVCAVVWLKWRRRRWAEPRSAETEARRALQRLCGSPEDRAVLGEVAGIVRRYFLAAFRFPEGETTDRETIRLLLESEEVGPALAGVAVEFLHECEHRRFSPEPDPVPMRAVERAQALVEASEERLRELARVQPIVAEAPAA